jgi:hypothetical protein
MLLAVMFAIEPTQQMYDYLQGLLLKLLLHFFQVRHQTIRAPQGQHKADAEVRVSQDPSFAQDWLPLELSPLSS